MDFDGYALDAVMLVGTTPDAHHADDPLASVDALRDLFAPRPWVAGRVRQSDLAPLRRLRQRRPVPHLRLRPAPTHPRRSLLRR